MQKYVFFPYKSIYLQKFFDMRKTFILILLTVMTLSSYSQDWFGVNRYKADNARIIEEHDYPEVVFIGNSITEIWADYHPEFFDSHHFCGRGIGGQTSAHILVRFTADVIDLHPKAVVIMAGTNDVAHNDFWAEPQGIVENIAAMCTLAQSNGIVPILCSIPPCSSFPWRKEIKNPGQTIVDINKELKAYANSKGYTFVDFHAALADENLGLPKSLSDDGCHPNPDTYYTMENMVLEAINNALKQ